jgi:hypothetical protein
LLRDPFPKKRTITLVPAVSWDVVSMIFADLSYRNEDTGEVTDASFVFDSSDKGVKRFTVGLTDPDKRLISYKVKYLLNDNSLVELPDSMTLQKEIFLRLDMKGHRVVTVQPANVDFAAKKVDQIQVKMSYDDAANGLNFASMFTFKSKAEKAFFEYDYVGKNEYTAQTTTTFRDGFRVVHDPVTLNQDVVNVEVG